MYDAILGNYEFDKELLRVMNNAVDDDNENTATVSLESTTTATTTTTTTNFTQMQHPTTTTAIYERQLITAQSYLVRLELPDTLTTDALEAEMLSRLDTLRRAWLDFAAKQHDPTTPS